MLLTDAGQWPLLAPIAAAARSLEHLPPCLVVFESGVTLFFGDPAHRTSIDAHRVQAPALGLSTSGQLYWGSRLVAPDVTSFATRSGGAGGPALLYCTRRNLLYTVFFTQARAAAVLVCAVNMRFL